MSIDLQRHPLPEAIHCLDQLQTFVEHHVFAVWDFMLLLKALQQHLAPSGVPWRPPAHPKIAGLINALVAEEECDCLPEALGGPRHLSHFAIYRLAMQEIGADTTAIDAVVDQAMAADLNSAMEHPAIPVAASRLMATTQSLIREADLPGLAAAYAYGRELLVPELFRSLLARLRLLDLACPTFCWYLERHIDLDGETHGPLAEEMVQVLVRSNRAAMARVEQVRQLVIRDRIDFWDALQAELSTAVPA